MPWVTSILVLQPRISIESRGPPGGLVSVFAGVSEGMSVGAVVAVMKGIGVDVGIVAEAVRLAAMMTGVAVWIEGVFVGGRKGVGGLAGPGWITQPLQDASKSIDRIVKMFFFISSPPGHCTPPTT
jgi:hypothetical protein